MKLKKTFISITASILLFCSSVVISSCGANKNNQNASTPCGDYKITVSVSIQQWADIAKTIGGECIDETTIISQSSIDPHEFEPTAKDISTLVSSNIAVINGQDYDVWAKDELQNSPSILDISSIDTNQKISSNPHLWYSPYMINSFANAFKDRILEYTKVNSQYFNYDNAQKYLLNQINVFSQKYQVYLNILDEKKKKASGQTSQYIATESVANYLFDYLGFKDLTPKSYANAVASESEVSPQDLDQMLNQLSLWKGSSAKYLIYNTQEADSVTQKIYDQAKANNIKIIEVSETMPDDYTSLLQWMISISEQI